MTRGTNAHRSNVLVIHGDRAWRQRYAEALIAAGWHVVTVSNGHGATELAAASRTSVVVTAARPAGAIDGFEITRRLRVADRTRHVRVVLLTDGSVDENCIRAEAVGCDLCLEQPCSPGVLAAEISRLIAHGDGAARPERDEPAKARLRQAR